MANGLQEHENHHGRHPPELQETAQEACDQEAVVRSSWSPLDVFPFYQNELGTWEA